MLLPCAPAFTSGLSVARNSSGAEAPSKLLRNLSRHAKANSITQILKVLKT
jgi:hypothetical protein